MGEDDDSGGMLSGDFVSTIAAGSSTLGDAVGDVFSGAVDIGGNIVDSLSSAAGDLVSIPSNLISAAGDLTSALSGAGGLGDLLSSADFSSLSSIGDIADSAADFPIVGPNIGYKRILWLFSGESQINSIEALFTGVINGIRDIAGTLRDCMKQFSKD